MDDTGRVSTYLVFALCAIPICVFVLAGRRAFHGLPPLVFHCRRCSKRFLKRPYQRFPKSCPHCRARDWNA